MTEADFDLPGLRRQFAESVETLDAMKERLQSISLSDEHISATRDSISDAASAVRESSAALAGLVGGLDSAAGAMMSGLDRVDKFLAKTDLSVLDDRMEALRSDLDQRLATSSGAVDERMASLGANIDERLEANVEKLGVRLDKIEQDLVRISDGISTEQELRGEIERIRGALSKRQLKKLSPRNDEI